MCFASSAPPPLLCCTRLFLPCGIPTHKLTAPLPPFFLRRPQIWRSWPYLERFTIDATLEILAEAGGKPDFIVGNYSDGNLVATLMAHRMDVTQCNIAHVSAGRAGCTDTYIRH